MVMPGMDGPTLVDILRKIDPAVRLMGMSGFDERTGSGAPWDLPLFLTKPFSAEKLLLAVHELLQAPADKPPRG